MRIFFIVVIKSFLKVLKNLNLILENKNKNCLRWQTEIYQLISVSQLFSSINFIKIEKFIEIEWATEKTQRRRNT